MGIIQTERISEREVGSYLVDEILSSQERIRQNNKEIEKINKVLEVLKNGSR